MPYISLPPIHASKQTLREASLDVLLPIVSYFYDEDAEKLDAEGAMSASSALMGQALRKAADGMTTSRDRHNAHLLFKIIDEALLSQTMEFGGNRDALVKIEDILIPYEHYSHEIPTPLSFFETTAPLAELPLNSAAVFRGDYEYLLSQAKLNNSEGVLVALSAATKIMRHGYNEFPSEHCYNLVVSTLVGSAFASPIDQSQMVPHRILRSSPTIQQAGHELFVESYEKTVKVAADKLWPQTLFSSLGVALGSAISLAANPKSVTPQKSESLAEQFLLAADKFLKDTLQPRYPEIADIPDAHFTVQRAKDKKGTLPYAPFAGSAKDQPTPVEAAIAAHLNDFAVAKWGLYQFSKWDIASAFVFSLIKGIVTADIFLPPTVALRSAFSHAAVAAFTRPTTREGAMPEWRQGQEPVLPHAKSDTAHQRPLPH